MSQRSSEIQGAPKPFCSLPPFLLYIRVIFLLIIRHTKHMPGVQNGHGGTTMWQRLLYMQPLLTNRQHHTSSCSACAVMLVAPASLCQIWLLDPSGLSFSHTGCADKTMKASGRNFCQHVSFYYCYRLASSKSKDRVPSLLLPKFYNLQPALLNAENTAILQGNSGK